MGRLNEIIEWQEHGSEYRLYVKHHSEGEGKVNIRIIFEDATHDKVTEINIPPEKVKQFLRAVNGNLMSRKYEINL